MILATRPTQHAPVRTTYSYGARELANTAYGLARLDAYDRRLWQLMLARARPAAFNNQVRICIELSAGWWCT